LVLEGSGKWLGFKKEDKISIGRQIEEKFLNSQKNSG
jgi:hypothetical protein